MKIKYITKRAGSSFFNENKCFILYENLRQTGFLSLISTYLLLVFKVVQKYNRKL